MYLIWLYVSYAGIFAETWLDNLTINRPIFINLITYNMKQFFIAAILAIAPLSVFSQKFGSVNVSDVIYLMPEYKAADNELQSLQTMYNEELEYMQKEYEKKIDDYQTQHDNLSDDLRERREEEIMNSRQRIAQYIQESDIKYQNKQIELMNNVHDKALKAIQSVGEEGGFVCIFDISSAAVPFVNSTLTTDVTEEVKSKLGIK